MLFLKLRKNIRVTLLNEKLQTKYFATKLTDIYLMNIYMQRLAMVTKLTSYGIDYASTSRLRLRLRLRPE